MSLIDTRDTTRHRRDCRIAHDVRPIVGRAGSSRIGARPRGVGDIALADTSFMVGAVRMAGGIWVRRRHAAALPQIIMTLGGTRPDTGVNGNPFVLYIANGTRAQAGDLVLSVDMFISTNVRQVKSVAWGSDWHYIAFYASWQSLDIEAGLSLAGNPIFQVSSGQEPGVTPGASPLLIGGDGLDVDEAWIRLNSDAPFTPAEGRAAAVAPFAARDGGIAAYGRSVLNQDPSVYYRFDHVNRNPVDIPTFTA